MTEITFLCRTYTIRLLDDVRTVLIKGRGHLWHVANERMQRAVLASFDVVAVLS